MHKKHLKYTKKRLFKAHILPVDIFEENLISSIIQLKFDVAIKTASLP